MLDKTRLRQRQRMHPAWAGAGGNWPAIDEVFDPSVVRQQDNLSCGAACGEMLLRDYGLTISQAALVASLGVPITARGLATQEEVFETLNTTGAWAAMLWETGSKIGHMVIVDGMTGDGFVFIRDPWEGTRYKMRKSDFLEYWNDYGVYRRRL